ncbi:pimeloyl-ACP methyl ester carboxylesterase [Prauserella sediminis]|uniref:Pimeloyl-ACP methyl ester carboxylesterase n=1 Tax=Prauserella sediminis TaxID=577680 RepID=A0A839XUG5_9PSEU|nr:alpha/beta hydrolase [Prauserella sediminis]MBB3664678.1 pimeloyl-ACP methyl ester carboxylesterase [Prauserella sediminis]
MDFDSDAEAPSWFRTALAERPEHRDTTVDDGKVHLRCWGAEHHPGVVLVHGGSAHSGWWDHIAPLLAQHRRVVAVDLSGHGDSAARESYDITLWAREVVAAADAGGVDRPFHVIGHSMGGWVTAQTGADFADRLTGLTIIDSPLNDRPPENRRARPVRVYPDRETILGRFRTLPPQDVLLPYIRRHIAEESVRAVDEGWTWKFDPTLKAPYTPLRGILPRIDRPTSFIRTEHGLVSPEMAREIRSLLRCRTVLVDLPDAGHHPMLDRPLALVTALRTILAAAGD